MQEKINQINQINISIKEAKKFLSLLEKTNIKSEYKNQINNFDCFTISSYICTGSESPKYTENIQDIDLMNALSEAMKVVLREGIAQKELALADLIK